MLTTGNQLKAGRALAGLDQGTLAKLAGVNINTISAMEKKGSDRLTSGLDKITGVMLVLEGEGIEFLNHGKPGVRLVNQLLPMFKHLSFHQIMCMPWSPWTACASAEQAATQIRETWDVSAQVNPAGGACFADENANLLVAEWRYVGGGRAQPWEFKIRTT
jgi:transcriptional regulator with XRE-family HTH domain